jgi:hypothetical protein
MSAPLSPSCGERLRAEQHEIEAPCRRHCCAPSAHNRLGALRTDQPKFGKIPIASVPAGIALGDEDARENAALAQEAFEALMRSCSPAFQRAALIGIDACCFDADKKLKTFSITAEFAQCPGGGERRLVLRQANLELLGERSTAGATDNML